MTTSNMSTLSPKVDNFFALFDIPVDFDVEISLLEQRLRQLQQQYHPDNAVISNKVRDNSVGASDSAGAGNDSVAVNNAEALITNNSEKNTNKNSALINHAYQILRYPDSRASYLLQMKSQDAELNDSISDLDFLESAMELRIELDETESVNTLKDLISTVNAKIDTHSDEFKTAYQDKKWQLAIDATQKLKFLVKLKKDIENKIDSLLTADDEDDLYV